MKQNLSLKAIDMSTTFLDMNNYHHDYTSVKIVILITISSIINHFQSHLNILLYKVLFELLYDIQISNETFLAFLSHFFDPPFAHILYLLLWLYRSKPLQ